MKHCKLRIGIHTGLKFILALMLIFLVVDPSHARDSRTSDSLPNFDKRTNFSSARQRPAADPSLQAAVDKLKETVGSVQVDFDRIVGSPRLISAKGEFLSGTNGQGKGISSSKLLAVPAADPHRITKAFLNEHSALFGFNATELDVARLKTDYTTEHNGLRTSVWEQQLDGIPIFDALLVSHITKRGELVQISSGFLRNLRLAAEDAISIRDLANKDLPVSVIQAIAIAATNLGENVVESDIKPVGDASTGPDRRQRFLAPMLLGETLAALIWLPTSPSTVRLCWDVTLKGKSRGEVYRLLIDAQTGGVMVRHCRTFYYSNASYRVFVSDSPSPFSPGCSTPCTTQPPIVPRQLVTLAALSSTASPNGWINDGDNTTVGNNVDAHLDRDANDIPDPGSRPVGVPARTFDFTLDLTQPPIAYTNAAVVQLFYWNNWMHDKLYELGFTEAAGNFQSNNFGRGGLGGDAVQADAQDSAGVPVNNTNRSNANFSITSDGVPPRMQMYIYDGPSPDRDGDMDAEIILHEYTHGLTDRLVGNGTGLSGLQCSGMSEGWSDFYAQTLLSEPGDSLSGTYASGAYSAQDYYFGDRRYPYSTDLTKNPLTFKDIDPNHASAHAGVPIGSIISYAADEPHNMGEVWCVTLWEARANLITKYGWAGNQLILQLVTDGLKYCPNNPNFLEARNAILQADQVNNGGANLAELWAAFAKRGMGFSATSPLSEFTIPVSEAYDIPPPPTIITSALTNGFVGSSYSQVVLATGNGDPFRWYVSAGNLPPGLALSLTSGAINGTPTTSGAYNFTIRVIGTSGAFSERTFSIQIGSGPLFITTSPLPTGSVGINYNKLLLVTGGAPPYQWSITSGGLPSGLDLDIGSGVIFGVPDAAGTYTVNVRVTDTNSVSSEREFSITINSGLTIMNPNPLPTGWLGAGYNVTLQASGGIPPYTWALTGNPPPQGLSWDGSLGRLFGTPASAGNYFLGVRVNDSSGQIASTTFALVIQTSPDVPTITTPSPLPSGLVGKPYNFALSATGGDTSFPYFWDDISVLPWGLNLGVANGVISGTPSTAGNYIFTVEVSDFSNRYSWKDFSMQIDHSKSPTVSIVSPISGQIYTTPQTVTLTASAADDVKIIKVEFYDGNTLMATKTTTPYQYAWNVTSAKNGVHNWTARAFDGENLYVASSRVALSINIETNPPSVSIIQPADGSSITNSSPVLFVADALDNVGVTKVEFFDDYGGSKKLVCTAAGAPFTCAWQPQSKDNGNHAWTARAYDAVGNFTNSAPVNLAVSLETNPPNVSIISPVSGSIFTNLQAVPIIATAADDTSIAKVEFYDGSSLQGVDQSAPFTFNWQMASAAAGTHVWTAKAYDVYGNARVSSDVFLTVATCSLGWVLVSPPNAPSARYGHAMAANPQGGLVLFGGMASARRTADTWVWDGMNWLQKTPATNPPARSEHAMAFDSFRNRVVLFGGSSNNVEVGDTWEWNGTNWVAYSPAIKPLARYAHGMAYDEIRKRVVLFGGLQYANPAISRFLGDTWEWDGTNWLQVATNGPQARCGLAMTYDPSRSGIVLFGGFGQTYFADTWEWDGNTWTQKPAVTSPPARAWHALAYDRTSGFTFLMGGNNNYALGDLWGWQGDSWFQLSPTPNMTARYEHKMAFDNLRERLIVFGGFDSSYKNDTYELANVDSPRVSNQPANVLTIAGKSISFSANAVGSPPLIYYWRKNGAQIADGSNISGANSPMLTITNVQPADDGNYDVIISGRCGFTVSSNANLTVSAITSQPASQSATASNNVTFSVSTVGTSPFTYRWRFNSSFLPGATNSFFTTNNVRCASAGAYSVIVSNVAGSITSAPAVLSINYLPTITTHPSNQVANIGSNVTFRVVSTNCSSSILTYQWRFNGVDIPGATATNYTLAGVQTGDAGVYHVAITNVAGTFISSNAILTVVEPPKNQVICQGMGVSFCTAATGPLISSYQWRSNSALIANATNPCYTRLSVQPTNTVAYSVIVSNITGRITNSATLTVYSLPPTNTVNPVSRIVAAGSSATFCVTAVRAKGYQWRFNTNNIADATNSCYTITNCQPDHAGAYSVLVANDCGVTVSSNANLAVVLPPVPDRIDLLAGGSATFCELVYGATPLSYQWRFNGTNVVGATNICYTCTNAQPANGGTYSVRVTNNAGSVTSAVATLVVHAPPIIVQQPGYQVAEVGKPASFSVTASGTVPASFLSYQWRLNGVDIPGATSRTNKIDSVQTINAGDYSVVVSNIAGAVVSSNAPLVVQAWSDRYQAGVGKLADQARAIALGTDDRVYVAGFVNPKSGNDYATLCYSFREICGDKVWDDSSAKYDGPGNGDDKVVAVACDTNGNVYVTGTSAGSGTGRDYATIKYLSDGTAVWTNRYNGPGNSHDDATNIVVDVAGNVYVTGSSIGSGTSYDFATIKFSTAGAGIWTNRYTSAGNYADRATALAVDASGNVFVTGFSHGTGDDYTTLKYAPNGTALWTNRYNGPGNSTDHPTAICLDDDGNVFVSGYSYRGSVGSYDFATIKYSADGVGLWTNRYSSSGSFADRATAMAVDAAGNVYVTGYSHGTGDDYTTLKYTPDGVAVWTNRYNGTGNSTDQAAAIAVDTETNIYVTGFSTGSGHDFLTVKYSAGGFERWVARGSASSGADEAAALAVDTAGNVYVTGFSYNSVSGNDLVTVKFIQSPTITTCTNSPRKGLGVLGIGDEPADPGIRPSIATDPESQVVLAGADATFTVGVDGSLPFAFQWRFDSAKINGAVGASYTVTNAQPEDAGDYSVVVTNIAGSVASVVARLTVLTSLPLLSQPRITSEGEFSFTVRGDPGYIYSVEMSEDLMEWTQVGFFVNITGEVLIFDPNPKDAISRFYRVSIVP